MKQCTKCGVVKPLDEFDKAAGTSDGHRDDWKPCNLAAQAGRIRLNPEANRERARQWRLANPERAAARQKEYQAAGRNVSSIEGVT